jgi:hypothetical protein
MRLIRIPYPSDPETRHSLFTRAAAVLSQHGTYEGTPETGQFHCQSPVGRFAGSYRVVEDSLEITLTRKPRLVPVSLIEHELRRLIQTS